MHIKKGKKRKKVYRYIIGAGGVNEERDHEKQHCCNTAVTSRKR